jgi:anti-anti-sigma factor
MDNDDIVPEFNSETNENLSLDLQKREDVEGCLVLALHGFIDTYNADFFQKQAKKAIETGYIHLIVNCAGLESVSSAGIGAFAVILKVLKSQDGDLVLCELQPGVQDVFHLLGFSRFFTIKKSMEDAVALFTSGKDSDAEAIFPRIFPCPVCSKNLKAVKPGRFRCCECKTILAIDNTGSIFLG